MTWSDYAHITQFVEEQEKNKRKKFFFFCTHPKGEKFVSILIAFLPSEVI